MKLIQIENHMDIYEDKTIKEVLFLAIHGATDGKVKSAAQSLYSKQQGLFYVCEKEEQVVGIIGLKQIDNEKLELVHLAVVPEQRGADIGKWMIDKVMDFTRIPAMYMEADAREASYLEKKGFEVKEMDDSGLDQYLCVYTDAKNI